MGTRSEAAGEGRQDRLHHQRHAALRRHRPLPERLIIREIKIRNKKQDTPQASCFLCFLKKIDRCLLIYN